MISRVSPRIAWLFAAPALFVTGGVAATSRAGAMTAFAAGAVILCIGLIGVDRRAIDVLLVSVIALSGIVDLPRALALGRFTGLAALTGIYAVSFALVLIPWYHSWSSDIKRATWPILAFVGWAVVSLGWSRVTVAAAQNLLVLYCFGAAILVGVAAAKTGRDPSGSPHEHLT